MLRRHVFNVFVHLQQVGGTALGVLHPSPCLPLTPEAPYLTGTPALYSPRSEVLAQPLLALATRSPHTPDA